MSLDGPITEMLTACLTTGAVLDLIPEVPSDAVVGEETMRDWDQRHDVDAAFVRDLLLGRVTAVPDPRGLRLRGVRVRGRLDLNLVRCGVPLEIRDSLLEEGLSADQAHFPTLEVVGCRIRHPTMIALDLDRVQVDGAMYLNRCRISASTFEGAVRLVDARLGGSLFGKRLVVENAAGPAVLAHGLRVERDLFLQPGFVADGHSEEGAIAMTDARVGACVWLAGARLRNTAGPAISWDGLQTVRDVVGVPRGYSSQVSPASYERPDRSDESFATRRRWPRAEGSVQPPKPPTNSFAP